MPNYKKDWELFLYNDANETLLVSSDYKEISKFLGKRLEGVTTMIHRLRYGLTKNAYDNKGNKYKAEIVEKEPKTNNAKIEKAIEYIYECGTLNTNTQYGKVFLNLLDILEGED